MQSFVYNALPGRVIFGQGTVSALKSEMERAGRTRALLLSTPEQAAALKDIAASIGALAAGTFTDAAMHTPTDVTARALRAARDCDADCTIAFGGGSSTGLGKAIALRTDLIQIVIPTTYAGSEITPIIGETEGGQKITQRTLRVLPEIVIYDVDFSLTLPPRLTVTSGTNAIAHAVEALYAQDRNPVISMMAEQAIAAMGARSLQSSPIPRTGKRVRRRSTAHGCAESALDQSVWHCTTSFVMWWAGPSTCRMRTRTRSFCLTPWPTTQQQRRRLTRRLLAPSAAVAGHRPWSIWPGTRQSEQPEIDWNEGTRHRAGGRSRRAEPILESATYHRSAIRDLITNAWAGDIELYLPGT